jgi:hypothetical protein
MTRLHIGYLALFAGLLMFGVWLLLWSGWGWAISPGFGLTMFGMAGLIETLACAFKQAGDLREQNAQALAQFEREEREWRQRNRELVLRSGWAAWLHHHEMIAAGQFERLEADPAKLETQEHQALIEMARQMLRHQGGAS